MNIIEAINDTNLFRPFLQDDHGDIESWREWKTALRALHGLPITRPADRLLVRECTGRSYKSLPKAGFRAALFLTGRRSGKSRISALAAAYEAILSGKHKLLAKGEEGLVVCVSPTRAQSQIVKSYIRGIFETSELLRSQVIAEQRDGFALRNNTQIRILAGDYRSVRGFTLLAAVVDEAAFFGIADEQKVRSDTELIRAIQPSLATLDGKLIAITTPYAKKGWCYSTWKRNFSNPNGNVLVWRCPSMEMNPTLSQAIIDDAMAEDPAAARSEYLAEWREDVAAYIPREIVEGLVIMGRKSLMPRAGVRYTAFVDVSGGRHDEATIAISHLEGRKVVLDFCEAFRPPFSPYDIIRQMVAMARPYNVQKVIGDNYAAEFTQRAFEACGMRYERCDKPKSELYLELLPRLCSGEIELLDNPRAINQIASLERRTRAGGRDIIDHPAKCHDDLANSIAGAAVVASTHRIHAGSFFQETARRRTLSQLAMQGFGNRT